MSPGTGSSSRISLVARVQSLSMLGLYQLAEFLPYCGGPSRAEEATRTGIILKEQTGRTTGKSQAVDEYRRARDNRQVLRSNRGQTSQEQQASLRQWRRTAHLGS